MAVSRLDSHGANIRAINAAKSAGRNARVDSILIRLSTISHPDELAGAMLDRIVGADAVLSRRVPLAVAAYCAENGRATPGSLSEACREIGYDLVCKIVQIVGINAIHEELAVRCGLSKTHLTNQAVAVAVGAEFLAKKIGLPGPLGFSCG
ncbi:MAG: HDOD domain-containing protein, partial [Fimbriimonadaceae bacterium]|nr:HDOD domain-containing protein [Fimbriimonadaceae bacterium]